MINVRLTNNPHSIAAITEVIDLLILVKSINDITIEEISVKKKFFNKNCLTKNGK